MSALFPKSSLPHSGAPLTITASTAPTSALAHREQAQEALDAARLAYEAAFTAARRLPAANVVRLGLALNIAVFYHDLVRSPDKVSCFFIFLPEEGLSHGCLCCFNRFAFTSFTHSFWLATRGPGLPAGQARV